MISPHRRRPAGWIAAAAAVLALTAVLAAPSALAAAPAGAPAAAPSSSSAAAHAAKHGQRAQRRGHSRRGPRAVIRRTAFGIPHITAHSYEGLGLGYGYAFAQDNLCQLADDLVTVSAQRSRYFGPDGSDDEGKNNLSSDFFYQWYKDRRVVQHQLAKRPPRGPSREARQLVRGFAAGYNRYLRRTGVDHLPDPRCRGAAWVRPIRPIDLWRRYLQLAQFASSGNFLEQLVDAQPPVPHATGASAASSAPRRPSPSLTRAQLIGASQSDLGSNAYALGRDATANGRGMVLGNPHFPWQGGRRFYEAQITIPGELNATGSSLLGVPVINIGHTAGVAWSHTVSTAYRFTPYELALVPGDPTSYMLDGRKVAMKKQTVHVRVRGDGGALTTQAHTFYTTRWGPIFNYTTAGFLWTAEHAYALADANGANLRVADQWLDMDKAQNVHQLRRALLRDMGDPWVNTIAADRRGRAMYADISVVPHVSTAQVKRCLTPGIGTLVFAQVGLPVLDGSRSDCRWGSDPGTPVKGIFGKRSLPVLVRSDYVTNSNDSYWLSNPEHPLTGFARIIGDEGTARSLRTRLGLIMVAQRLAGTDGLRGDKFTLRNLMKIEFNDRDYSGELLRDAVVALCRKTPSAVPPEGGAAVDLEPACDALAGWDVHGNADSRGELLWRAFFERLGDLSGGPFSVPFDIKDPVHTPNTLTTDSGGVLSALAGAVGDLAEHGIGVDAALGKWQIRPLPGGRSLPIHGCPGSEGCFNVISTDRRADGKFVPVAGSSFVMAATWDRRGRPRANAILTYSQSTNRRSRHYSDQTRIYSRKGRWPRMLWTDREIRRSHGERTTRLR